MKSGPILWIEDDIDDQECFEQAVRELGYKNKIIFFTDGNEALSFLRTTSIPPFIVICDINLPTINGIEIRDEIFFDEYLRCKSIPFVFLSTTAEEKIVAEAYRLSVQGFFIKPNHFEEIKSTLGEILHYWGKCKHPNNIAVKV